MALKTQTKGGGSFFKAKDYVTAEAVLIEVIDYRADQPNVTFGGTRDEVVADLTIFPTADSFTGTPEPVILKRAVLTGRGVTDDLKGEVGSQIAYKLAIQPAKQAGRQPFPVWRELDVAVVEKVEEYLKVRDAAVQQALEADLPDYMK